MKMQGYKSVDEYLANFNGETLAKLLTMRRIIKNNVPEGTEEKIAYGIPTYKLKRNIVHFGGYDTHVALYPGAAAIKAFKDDLKKYETAKGTIRFKLDKPLPKKLIAGIIQAAVESVTGGK